MPFQGACPTAALLLHLPRVWEQLSSRAVGQEETRLEASESPLLHGVHSTAHPASAQAPGRAMSELELRRARAGSEQLAGLGRRDAGFETDKATGQKRGLQGTGWALRR